MIYRERLTSYSHLLERLKGGDIVVKIWKTSSRAKIRLLFLEIIDRTKVKKHRMILGKKLSRRKDNEAMEQTGELPML